MDAVGQTAYYCCGVRAADAASGKPVCGDQYAQRFMTEEGRAAFAPFAGLTTPNASNATRARLIDDLLRARLRDDPRQKIILMGAGFDTRAYRLGGGDWVEFDQPELLARKTSLLPISECPSPLTRVGVDFSHDVLARKLAPFKGTPHALVVLEGVSMYLTPEQQKQTLAALAAAFPGHTLICDLMSARFANRVASSFRAILRGLGTDFAAQRDDPRQTFLEAGYVAEQRLSILGRARELGAVRIPGFLFNTVLRTLRDGYCVHVFKAPG